MKIIISKDKKNPVEILVDDDTFTWASQYKWYTGGQNGGPSRVYRKDKTLPYLGKNRIAQKLSREIMNNPQEMIVDHIDRNPLNNQRSNLRVCTKAQNSWNQGKSKLRTTSKYKGLKYIKRLNKWATTIIINGKGKQLGMSETQEEAALLYNQGALKYFGQYACLNII